jgi:hypothetical protein
MLCARVGGRAQIMACGDRIGPYGVASAVPPPLRQRVPLLSPTHVTWVAGTHGDGNDVEIKWKGNGPLYRSWHGGDYIHMTFSLSHVPRVWAITMHAASVLSVVGSIRVNDECWWDMSQCPQCTYVKP